MSLSKEFEKWLTSAPLWIRGSTLAEDSAWHGFKAHQIEINGLKAENERIRKDAERYQWLRKRDLETIDKGGVFAGVVPDNEVINGDDLDVAIDTAIRCEQ